MARRNTNPTSDLFYNWSPMSILGFWIITIFIASCVFLFNIPAGLSLFVMLFLLPLVWKDPNADDAIHGMMVRDTIPWKIATFMSVMKGPARKHIFELDDMFGVGPPEDDHLQNLQESFFNPPGRVSAYFSMGFAFVLSFIDWLIDPIIVPVWGWGKEGDVFMLPTLISQIISFVFFYASIQALNTARRHQLALPMSGVDKVPAVIWQKIPKGTIGDSYKKFIITGAISTAIFMVLAIGIAMLTPINWWVTALIAIVLGVSVGVYMMFVQLSEKYREDFNFQVERRDTFNEIFAFKGDKIPYFEMQVPVPGEPGKPGGPPLGSDEVPETHVWVATFMYPLNGEYTDFENDAKKVNPSIPEAKMMVVVPIPEKDESSGETKSIPGTISKSGFRLWWSDLYISLDELLKNRDITKELKEVAIRYNVFEPLANIKSIGRCIMHTHTMMTTPESKVNIMKVSLIPMSSATEKDFVNNIEVIKQKLSADWVRVKKSVDPDYKRGIINLYIGDGAPDDPGIEFPPGLVSSKIKKELMTVHWEYVFSINKISAPTGYPSMILSRSVTDKSEELVFNLPAGISAKSVKNVLDDLGTTSGNQFIEFHNGVPSKKMFKRKEKRELDRFLNSSDSKSQFTLITSKTHPLDDTFYFSKFKDQLITGRTLGVLKSQWAVGMKANGELLFHSFEKGSDPHLVLAGSSGSGKSALLYSMVTQLCANNNPEDLQFSIIDPKLGFQGFQYIDNVTRYIDNWTPREGHFFEACRDMLRDTAGEMVRRNKAFRFATHTDGITPYEDEFIDKLSTARRIGISQGPMDDGSPNPLIIPMLIVIMDEVAMLFADAPDPETKELQKEILYYATKLARESRSAGIHCVFSTQYPTKASLPSLIKQQSERIGLRTQDNMASLVIIDEPGLETLHLPGSGKAKDGDNYAEFRGLLLEDDSAGEHSMTEILSTLPKRIPSVAIDGQDAVDRYNAIRKLKGEEEITGDETGNDLSGGADDYIIAPEPIKSVFDQWDTDPLSPAQDFKSWTSPKKDKDGKITNKGSKADKLQTFLETIDVSGMKDDEFDMTLEEFKAKFKSFQDVSK